MRQGNVDEATRRVPDTMVNALAAAGTPKEALKKLKEYEAAGVTLPIIMPIGSKVEIAIETAGALLK